MKSPYKPETAADVIFTYLQNIDNPCPITEIAENIGEDYKWVYNAVTRDTLGAITFTTVDGVRCVALGEGYDVASIPPVMKTPLPPEEEGGLPKEVRDGWELGKDASKPVEERTPKAVYIVIPNKNDLDVYLNKDAAISFASTSEGGVVLQVTGADVVEMEVTVTELSIEALRSET